MARAEKSAGLRVLVVDDYPDAASVVCSVVELLGHTALAATTGRQGLAIAESGAFDIALVDIGLPDLSGLEVARAIRKLPSGPALFLVAMSGWGQPKDRIRAIEAGFDHYIVKPIDGAIVERVLELARTR